MMILYKLAFFIVITFLFSCRDNQKNSFIYEQAVMEEIFPELMDSIWVEITFSNMPPPVREVYDTNSRRIVLKPSEKNDIFKESIIQDLEAIKEGSHTVTILVNDIIHKIEEENKDKLCRHFKSAILSENKDAAEYKMDLRRYKPDKGFKLILASEWKTKKRNEVEEYMLLKEISFSRILFDKDKKFGILTCEYIRGSLDGIGYRIFIKNVNEQWVIDKIELSWIA